MAALLALLAAVGWGSSDYAAGSASRRSSAVSVVILTHFAAVVALIVLALDFTPVWTMVADVRDTLLGSGPPGGIHWSLPAIGGDPTFADVRWGLAAGLGGGVGAMLLFRGLGKGSMAVVAPITATGAAAIPALYGIVTGEPVTFIGVVGILLALGAIVLVSLSADADEAVADDAETTLLPPPAAETDRPASDLADHEVVAAPAIVGEPLLARTAAPGPLPVQAPPPPPPPPAPLAPQSGSPVARRAGGPVALVEPPAGPGSLRVPPPPPPPPRPPSPPSPPRQPSADVPAPSAEPSIAQLAGGEIRMSLRRVRSTIVALTVAALLAAAVAAAGPISSIAAGEGLAPGDVASLSLAVVVVGLASFAAGATRLLFQVRSARPPHLERRTDPPSFDGRAVRVERRTDPSSLRLSAMLRLPGVPEALLSGVGFGAFFVFISRAGEEAGHWPLVSARAISVVMFAVAALVTSTALLPERGSRRWVVVAGLLDAAAAVCFVLATRAGLLSVGAVLASLYPGVTVVLARFVGHERIRRQQLFGLALAAVAVSLLAI